MFYARGFKTPQSGWCTIMYDGQACKSVPYYSNPRIEIPALKYKVFGDKLNNKLPPEALGKEYKIDNSRWIKENRFILANVGDESMKCPERRDINFRLGTFDCIINRDVTISNKRCPLLLW